MTARLCAFCRDYFDGEGRCRMCEPCKERARRRDGWLTSFCDYVPREPREGHPVPFPTDYYWPGLPVKPEPGEDDD